MAAEPRNRRLFIALWPDAGQRRQLRQVIHDLPQPRGGRSVKADNWHFTLKYIGPSDARQQACVTQVLETLTIPVVDLLIDHSGFFPRPRVVWLGCHQVPGNLSQLVTELESALQQQCDIAMENRPYVPHLTLYRKVRSYRGEELVKPLSLRFAGIALVESQSTPAGVHYEVLQYYPAHA